MLSILHRWVDRFTGQGVALPSLDVLILNARPDLPLPCKLEWLADVIQWIRRPGRKHSALNEEHFSASLPSLRLRRLLDVLDRHPEDKDRVSATLQSILREAHALDLLSEAGLPRHSSFLGEITERVLQTCLPAPVESGQLGLFVERVFHDPSDGDWVESLDCRLLERLRALYRSHLHSDASIKEPFSTELGDAIRRLAIQMSAIGCSSSIRTLLPQRSIQSVSFFKLPKVVEQLLEPANLQTNRPVAPHLMEVRLVLDGCFRQIDEWRAVLKTRGVNTEIVHQLMFLEASLQRFEDCLSLAFEPNQDLRRWQTLFAQLIRDRQNAHSIRGLLRTRFSLLARRVVERNGHTGEHYIAHTRAESWDLFKRAAGGGVVMSWTSAIKTFLFSFHFPPLLEGMLASLNYSVSFVGLQLAGFTLATKQPANTAPALASKMHRILEPQSLESLVDEMVALIRSQGLAILGNVALVIPCMGLLDLLITQLSGTPLMPAEKATRMIQSLSIFGISPLCAALTGALLFCSSLIGAWADNAYAFHQIARNLSADRRFIRILGTTRTHRLARWGQRWVGVIASNVSLAFMLGLIPALGVVSGFPLDVRHVTLSSGMLMQSLDSLGLQTLGTSDFWLASLGIVAIGLLNVVVSFALALWIAIRARGIVAPERRVLYRAFWYRLCQMSLSLPEHSPAPREPMLNSGPRVEFDGLTPTQALEFTPKNPRP